MENLEWKNVTVIVSGNLSKAQVDKFKNDYLNLFKPCGKPIIKPATTIVKKGG